MTPLRSNGLIGQLSWKVVSSEEVAEALLGSTPLLESAIEIAQAYGEGHPDSFAGLVAARTVLYIGFTTDVETHGSNLTSRIPDVDLRLFRADRSLADLRGLVDLISGQMAEFRHRGIGLWAVGINPR